MVTKISESKKVVKESYYDGMISLNELYNIKETINDLIDEMENNGITQISSSSNTYGLTNFIGTHSGFIDLDNPYQYLEYDEDEDEDEDFDESLHQESVSERTQLDSKYFLRLDDEGCRVETERGSLVRHFATEEEARDYWESDLK